MNKRLIKIIFFGSTKYSVIVAKTLESSFSLSAVVTISNRVDKHKNLKENPVKLFAKERGIPVLTADHLTREVVDQIASYRADFFVVDDYGLILPKMLLNMPKSAALNIHHSLLPKYRGPSPAPAAILNDEKESGVSIIAMTEKVDAGDILKQVPYSLKPDETTDSLLTELNKLGSQAVIEVINQFIAGKTEPKKQDGSKATYTKKISKEEGLLDLSVNPYQNWLKIRAFDGLFGAYFFARHRGEKIRVKVISADFQNGVLKILKVLPEGKKEMSYEDFLRGLMTKS